MSKNNAVASGSGIILQPVVVPMMETGVRQVNYPAMKVLSIRIFSSASIILGFASIGIQVFSNINNSNANN